MSLLSQKVFRSNPTVESVEINKEIYRIAKLPKEGVWFAGCLGKLCSIVVIENKNSVVITIDYGKTYYSIPLDCLEYVGIDI